MLSSTADRALVHPLSLGALVTLALNDHVLKGAGIVPPVVTGKSSDVAGLFVAPLLLAVIVRARTQRGVALCCAAVALVFAALELAPIAQLASRVLGVALWPDATDLLALPVLLLTLRLHARMQHDSTPVPRMLLAPVSASALLLCVATSPAYERYVRKPGARLHTTAVLSNASSEEERVHISLYEDPPCAALRAGDLSGIARLDVDESAYWRLEPRENIPLLAELDADPEAACYLLYVHGSLLLFERSALPARDVPHFGAVDSGVVRVYGPAQARHVDALAPIERLEYEWPAR